MKKIALTTWVCLFVLSAIAVQDNHISGRIFEFYWLL